MNDTIVCPGCQSADRYWRAHSITTMAPLPADRWAPDEHGWRVRTCPAHEWTYKLRWRTRRTRWLRRLTARLWSAI